MSKNILCAAVFCVPQYFVCRSILCAAVFCVPQYFDLKIHVDPL